MAPSDPASPAQASSALAWMEPLDAYRRLRASGHQPTLLASAGPHPEARWSFVAFDPAVEIRFKHEPDGEWSCEERWDGGAIEAGPADPLPYLRSLTMRHRMASEAAPFTGGWVGYFGFGFAAAVEPSLPQGPAHGEPDAILRLARCAVAFDHAARTATVFAADLDGDSDAARSRLAAGLADLARPSPPAHSQGPAAPWTTSLDQAGFEEAVRGLRGLVHDGDLFQANLATRFSAPFRGDPADLLGRLMAANPSPFMALLEFDGLAIASGSPEELFAASGGTIRSRPIAGTRKRGATVEEDAAMEAELLSDAKEQAEHTMLVDLVRNDLARVARPGTVRVAERCTIERYRHVMHLASRVEAAVRPGTDFADWLRALFPGGTVTGAPKVRATQRILEAEPVPRGPYTGSAGYVSWSRNAHWNILIRTVVVAEGTAQVHAGSGIVADSDPRREWKEAGRKAQALLEAATRDSGPRPTRMGEVVRHGTWTLPAAKPRHAGARVLLLDNYDSFVHNLADYAEALGAATRVVRNDADWRRALREHQPTHVILSPGPGRPEHAGCMPDLLRELHGRLPILGVCLGHQAIGQLAGGDVHTHPSGPVHGEPDFVHHDGVGLFAGLPSPIEAARYHSLVVRGPLASGWVVDARLADGTPMALRHLERPTYGLQFHPESLCTPLGLELIDRFMAIRAQDQAAQHTAVRSVASAPPAS